MTLKTKLKFLRARIRVFFTRKRYNSYKTNKRLLAIFLLVVNAYIYTDVFYHISRIIARALEPRIVIIIRETKTEEADSAVDSSENPSDVSDGSSVEAGETLDETGEAQELGQVSIENKIREMFPEEPEVMLAIAKAESKLNPHAINRANTDGSVDTGIFQVNSIHGYDEEYLKNEDNNIKVAREIYDRQGKEAWVAYLNGAYKKWL